MARRLTAILCIFCTTYIVGCKSASESAETHQKSSAVTGTVKVLVDGDGFQPSNVSTQKGQPLTLEFTRTTEKTCATQVTFPELNLTKDLPLNSPVAVQVPTETARRLTFQCGMGMFKSAVVIQ